MYIYTEFVQLIHGYHSNSYLWNKHVYVDENKVEAYYPNMGGT